MHNNYTIIVLLFGVFVRCDFGNRQDLTCDTRLAAEGRAKAPGGGETRRGAKLSGYREAGNRPHGGMCTCNWRRRFPVFGPLGSSALNRRSRKFTRQHDLLIIDMPGARGLYFFLDMLVNNYYLFSELISRSSTH